MSKTKLPTSKSDWATSDLSTEIACDMLPSSNPYPNMEWFDCGGWGGGGEQQQSDGYYGHQNGYPGYNDGANCSYYGGEAARGMGMQGMEMSASFNGCQGMAGVEDMFYTGVFVSMCVCLCGVHVCACVRARTSV